MKKIISNLSKFSMVLLVLLTAMTLLITIFAKKQTLLVSIGFSLGFALFWLINATKIVFIFYQHAYLSFPFWSKEKMHFAIKKTESRFSVALLLCMSISALYVTIIDLKTLATTPWDKIMVAHSKGFVTLFETDSLYLSLIPCIALVVHNIIAHIAESIMAKESPPS